MMVGLNADVSVQTHRKIKKRKKEKKKKRKRKTPDLLLPVLKYY